ncbi:MAG: glucan biosynthesis protein D [Pseudomonadales bacterium]|nr:glucan biosynthesis protein D [Pseudomonadales bacterium]
MTPRQKPGPSTDFSRRQFLQCLSAVAAVTAVPIPAWGVATQPFSFDAVLDKARKLARRPYQATPEVHTELLDKIDYDTYQKIQFRSDHALWAGNGDAYPVELFHLGRYARQPVAIHQIQEGQPRAIEYRPGLFNYEGSGISKPPQELGFAGFRVMNPQGTPGDWLAFQGASYFRSAGPLNQYGLSARGLAVDTATNGRQEEFPRFTAFWLDQLQDEGIIIYGLLDSPSVTGAYRFVCHRGNPVTMDVTSQLCFRKHIQQLGVAPLTSMYWYSETNGRTGTDWRPEVHDNDGLALWSGNGERIWRPLNNPAQMKVSSFMDQGPKGFGLLQRDRQFDHYQDDSVYYERRPGLWVEPLNDWGKGSVKLVELPTNDEIHDNIVAFWQPDNAPRAGEELGLEYRLHWVDNAPFPADLARVVATRIGRPGVPGQHGKRDQNGRKLVIDFQGGPLTTMEQRYDLEVKAETSRGKIRNPYALKVVGTDRWRAAFDLHVDGIEPVELRCYLKLQDRTLTESWLYQFHPGDYGIEDVNA